MAAVNIIRPELRLVAWEVTRRCNLLCAHCRAASHDDAYPDELTTEDCRRVVDEILEAGKPIIILTGGEPLMRADIFEIAGYAAGRGLRVVMGTNGTLIDDETARRLKEVPVARLGISLDFPRAELQDDFRGKRGAFQQALSGIEAARRAGIEVQINCTVTRLNLPHLDELLKLALDLKAVAFHPFLLVPTGRGKGLQPQELSPQEYERTLNWIYDRQSELKGRIFFKPTDAPHYMRVVSQRQSACPEGVHASAGGHPDGMTRGCLAGTGFCFISHTGKVQGCGYLTVEAGDIKRQTFWRIWADSPLFNRLRDLSNIKGKCGICEYKRICGGCRARAFEATGDYLEEEPYCVYRPAVAREAKPHG